MYTETEMRGSYIYARDGSRIEPPYIIILKLYFFVVFIRRILYNLNYISQFEKYLTKMTLL